ncbi:helix-turn-helix domain-containing protein [Rhodovulum marinum]|uniref:Helix-turn-helix protein n=1 Tax=Rhodovulum marinum TaxID=320662 RepID=A0A4R2QAV7_9RHOB|nr:helix-turn-helix transcriptional regulator [Rhodovulum marinum]TCP43955.1 helix-turn-helix protein [Rhodovulum marinum]
MTENPNTLPDAARFRAWLADSMRAAGLPASRLSLRSGLSVNTVGRILNAESDLTLGTAAKLERTLRALAAEADVELPALVSGVPS